jgi:hypothetical protein
MVSKDCVRTWGNKKNVPADALNFCDSKNNYIEPKTGHPPKSVSTYKKADHKLECDCNKERNAEIAGRKMIKVANNGRTEAKMNVQIKNEPCSILDMNEICARVRNDVFMGSVPVLESDPTDASLIEESMMINGLFYTKHAKKKVGNKMDKLLSLNTNPFDNPFCMSMNRNGCSQRACSSAHPFICGSCYSITTMSRQGASRWHFNNNLSILSRGIICEKQMPEFSPEETVRFNAEGELVNNVHLINLINIAAVNPRTVCTLFTKRWDILDDVINKCGYAPPKNMPIMFSNSYVDLPMTFDGLGYDFGHKLPPNNTYPLLPSGDWLQNGIVTGIFNVVYNMPRPEANEYIKARTSDLGERIQKCHLACFDCKACYPKSGNNARKFVVVENLKGLKGEEFND